LAKEQYREESNTGANNGYSTKDNARSQVKTGFDGTNNPRYIDSDGLTHDTEDIQYLKTSLGEVLGFVYKVRYISMKQKSLQRLHCMNILIFGIR
jgi:hypothetical protein